jgi:glucokinase
MIVLSGDIGGTSTRMQLTQFDRGQKVQLLKSIKYANQNFASFSDIIDTFLEDATVKKKQINSICFGVAGPIINGNVKFTNLPWAISSDDLKVQFDLQQIALINDFEAIGYGIETLGEKDLQILQEAIPREKGLKTFVGAGTGLGVGFMTFFDDSTAFNQQKVAM